eukprot:TRINITY_DN1788_c0_g2_i1.p1 TRINITY_DN1788_c0_g2~~TRINITY_DN1788_c0_g2_i1.p1  ORF type:complete len:484 (-),score=83.72 TRINITY_DN1788_c0_g2_i1:159-1610(-)
MAAAAAAVVETTLRQALPAVDGAAAAAAPAAAAGEGKPALPAPVTPRSRRSIATRASVAAGVPRGSSAARGSVRASIAAASPPGTAGAQELLSRIRDGIVRSGTRPGDLLRVLDPLGARILTVAELRTGLEKLDIKLHPDDLRTVVRHLSGDDLPSVGGFDDVVLSTLDFEKAVRLAARKSRADASLFGFVSATPRRASVGTPKAAMVSKGSYDWSKRTLLLDGSDAGSIYSPDASPAAGRASVCYSFGDMGPGGGARSASASPGGRSRFESVDGLSPTARERTQTGNSSIRQEGDSSATSCGGDFAAGGAVSSSASAYDPAAASRDGLPVFPWHTWRRAAGGPRDALLSARLHSGSLQDGSIARQRIFDGNSKAAVSGFMTTGNGSVEPLITDSRSGVSPAIPATRACRRAEEGCSIAERPRVICKLVKGVRRYPDCPLLKSKVREDVMGRPGASGGEVDGEPSGFFSLFESSAGLPSWSYR